jgi:hypothetical protein
MEGATDSFRVSKTLSLDPNFVARSVTAPDSQLIMPAAG